MSEITITEYFQNNPTQEMRQTHIDLDSPCIPYYLLINTKSKNAGDLASPIRAIGVAKTNILEFFNISKKFKSFKIHACHKCTNNSYSTNFVCINPLHIYIGTAKENSLDVDPHIRQQRGLKPATQKTKDTARILAPISVSKAISNGTHNTQIIYSCPYCNRSIKSLLGFKTHTKSCKLKTLSE